MKNRIYIYILPTYAELEKYLHLNQYTEKCFCQEKNEQKRGM